MKRMGLAAILVLCMAWTAQAAGVPKQISYSGKIADKNGNLLADGEYDMLFKLFSGPSGPERWKEEHYQAAGHAVTVSKGAYHVVLGEIAPLGNTSTTFNEDYYLEMAFKKPADTVWQTFPRQPLMTTPYSMRAEYSNQAVIALSIADNTVDSAKIVNGSVAADDLGSGVVTSAKVADGAIDGQPKAPWAPKVYKNGAQITNPKIACGSGVSGTTIQFGITFNNPPVVTTQADYCGDTTHPRFVNVRDITTTQFTAATWQQNGTEDQYFTNIIFSWIAVGD